MAYTVDTLRQQYTNQPPLDYDVPTDFWGAVKEEAREAARAVSPKLVKGSLASSLGSDQRVDFQRNSALGPDGKRYPVAQSFYPATSGNDVWGIQQPEGGGVVVLGKEKNTADKDVDDMVHRDGSQSLQGDLSLYRNPILPQHAANKTYADSKLADAPSSVTTSNIGNAQVTDAKLASNYAASTHTHNYAATTHNHDSAYVNLTEVSKTTATALPAGQAWVITPTGSAI